MPSFKAGSRTGYHRGDGALLPLRSASSAAPRHRLERRRLPGRTPRARHRVGDAGRIERGSPALFSMARQLEIVLLPRHARGDVPMTSHEGSHWRRTASAPRDSVSGSSRAAARVANSRCPRCRRARPSASGAKRRRGPGTGILRLQDSANGTLEVPNRAMPPRAPDGQPRGRIVNVPIRLYTATRTEGIACHLVHDRRGSRSKTNPPVPFPTWWCPERSFSAVSRPLKTSMPASPR